jgi:SAM-dependent methyltransferase
VAQVVDGLGNIKGKTVLEPSCGCGRFLDALRRAGADCFGIEYDAGRADQARAKGHRVFRGNFLDAPPTKDRDLVVMNPPFYGRHYEKHIRHALKFLKPGGKLVAILPASARYDHCGLEDLKPRWSDLPVGAFSQSGTNINTTICTVFA